MTIQDKEAQYKAQQSFKLMMLMETSLDDCDPLILYNIFLAGAARALVNMKPQISEVCWNETPEIFQTYIALANSGEKVHEMIAPKKPQLDKD